ncbi:RNase_H superfamily protein [uncultured archaeon]|nr:RNase_H superfamily protein [uncultured archaeon]
MIRESFIVLPHVGRRTEAKLWAQGLHSWDHFMGAVKVKGLSSARKDAFDWRLQEAKDNLRKGNSSFFSKMPDQWRLYNEFKDEAVYLDIETNGYYSGITVIGLSDGFDTKTFVRGFNLDRSLLIKELSKYKLIITFNGSSFDLPVINRFFDFSPNVPHIDLRFVCQKLGFTGGLKAIEKQFSIKRRPEVNGLSGEDAVYLWEMWKSSGEREYLDRLVWYNEEDILNLKPLADKLIPAMWQKVRYLKNDIALPTASCTAKGSCPVRT